MKKKESYFCFIDETSVSVQILVQKRLEKNIITTINNVDMGKTQWVYFDEKEIMKLSKNVMNEKALLYIWIQNNYVISFFSDEVEAEELEQIIKETRLVQ